MKTKRYEQISCLFLLNNSIPRILHIDSWDVNSVLKNMGDDILDFCCFHFETRQIEEIKEDGIYSIIPKTIKKSGTYFINAYIETAEDVAVKNDIKVINYMKKFGVKKVVRNIRGNDWCCVFKDKDEIIQVDSMIKV